MIFPDINLLIYAHVTSLEQHLPAKRWLEETLSNERTCFSWTTITGFVRITTSSRAFGQPFTLPEAFLSVDKMLSHSKTVILTPGADHFDLVKKLAIDSQMPGLKVTDAHLAAIAIANGVTFATNDRDFRKFDGLKVIYPLNSKV